ncbi:putative polyketide synthase, partial [Coniochaeta sp. 2T2.1]
SSSELNKVFLSAADKASISVTGPPSRLKSIFLSSQRLRYSKHLPLPVYFGLCHAAHVYTIDDVLSVVQGSDPQFNHNTCVRVPLFSPQKGEPFLAKSFGELLEEIVTEILTGGIYLDKLTAGVIGALGMSSDCHYTQFRSSIVSRGLVSGIERELPQLTLLKNDLLDWSTKDWLGHHPSSTKNAKLAVVGMSCRLPGGASDPDLFWKLMLDKRDAHTTIPADRFDVATHFDPTGKTPNCTETPYGNFIDNSGFLDAGFFNMSPFEAEQVDPMHRLALVTAYEALEMSGYSPGRTPSTNVKRVGTYYGQASDDWREVNTGQDIKTYGVPGTERAFANGRINYFFGFGGPSFNIDTACSSGLAAVNAACSALWAGEADTVLAGGLNVISNCDNYCGLSRGHFLSKTGQCKVWDKDADGYCRADGIVSVVIKRLDDAVDDNDNVLAVICAAATNHSAEAVSITHPHAGAQMDNYAQVMSAAGVSPLEVSYVELHGTGTQAGDAVESESVAGVFAPRGTRRRAEQRLHLGAVKSNVGHSEAAAGITSLLKVLLMYQCNEIPPHVGIKTEMNPVVVRNLDQRNVGLVFDTIPWEKPKGGKKRFALVNSFGAHGGNTTLLLEDAPERGRMGRDPRKSRVVTLSAKSKYSLRANAEALLGYLDEHPDTEVGDLAYTLCARRLHHGLRVSAPVESLEQVRRFLTASLDKIADVRPISSTTPSVVMTFTGQGAFYEGMSGQLYQDFPQYRTEIQQLDSLVQKMGLPSMLPHIELSGRNDSSPTASPMETQLCILVVEIAIIRFWKHLGIVPDAVIGHSLGEYAALVAAGVLSAADAIFLVSRRAMLMAEHCTPGSYAMISVRASADAIAQCVGDTAQYEVSCRNGREDTVISGKIEDVEVIRSALDSKGFKTVVLDVPYAFHTAQLDPVLPSFEEVASHITFKAPSIPIISPLLQDCIFDDKTINAKYLARATREPVLFVDALDAAKDLGIIDDKTVYIDVGPHPVCASLVRNWNRQAKSFGSLRRDEDNFVTLASTLSGIHNLGLPLRWNEYFRPYERSLRLLNLKSYRWNEKNYWIQYGGTWSLDKFWYAQGKQPPMRIGSAGHSAGALMGRESSLRTSSVHQVIEEEVFESKNGARLTAITDLRHPSLLPATRGHLMNGYGVATNSIWTDMALTIGEYLYKLAVPSAKNIDMNVGEADVLHAQVVRGDTNAPHLIQIKAELDLTTSTTTIKWRDFVSSQPAEQPFARVTIRYEDRTTWQREWSRVTHLVRSRLSDLDRLAASGQATRLNRKMAYTLFGNVVDYAEPYRGMQSVVLHDLEASAEITLAADDHGSWHSAPHYIDSVCHIGGMVLNGGDAVNTRDFFYVTPGFGTYRLMPRLKAGEKYRSYVRMEAHPTEANMYVGDVYILQGEEVVGMCGEMRFRKVPRKLMNHFFSPSDGKKDDKPAVSGIKAAPVVSFQPPPAVPSKQAQSSVTAAFPAPTTPSAQSTQPTEQQRLPVTPVATQQPKPAVQAIDTPQEGSSSI